MDNEQGSVTLTDVTLSGNTAVDGGGIYQFQCTATLTHVTLAHNHGAEGAGLWHYGDAGRSLTLQNVVLSGSAGGGNCYTGGGSLGKIVSAGFNLSDDLSCAFSLHQASDRNWTPAQLGPLQYNGGYSWTHLPLPASPLVDAGLCLPGLPSDQRGKSRPQGAGCDIGAERQPVEQRFVLYLPALLRR